MISKRKIIGLLNYWVIQLFFIRITMKLENDKVKLYSIMYFVLPFTGWNSNYKFIGKTKHLIL